MLPERLSRLLCGYVDGELSTVDRRAVEAILTQSPEARTYLSELQRDAERLRSLPRRSLDIDLVDRVLRRIESLPTRLADPTRRPWRTWRSYAATAAACMLLALGTLLYLGRPLPRMLQITVRNPVVKESHPDSRPDAVVQGDGGEPKREVVASIPHDEASPLPELLRAPTQESLDTLTVPLPDREVFRTARVPVALSLLMRDLDRPRTQQQILEEYRKLPATRVDLKCAETSYAMNRLRDAFRSVGVRLLIDDEAQKRLLFKEKEANYALFVEGLAAEEIATVVQFLRREDRKLEARPRGTGQFATLMVQGISEEDRQTLTRLIGTDPLRSTERKSELAKPLWLQQGELAVRLLAGPGGTFGGLGSHVFHIEPRLALVIAYNPVTPRPDSAEIRRFLQNRANQHPGTNSVLMVLRGRKG